MRRIRRHIQIVFQDPYTSLNPRMTVADIIGEPLACTATSCPRVDGRSASRSCWSPSGSAPSTSDRYPHQFSGGQRQRIGIARGMALNPEVLVATSRSRRWTCRCRPRSSTSCSDLQDELGLAFVFIAHDLSVVRHISDRVAVMYLGKIVETGTDAEVYERPTHPYTRALLSAVPVPDPGRVAPVSGSCSRVTCRPRPTRPPAAGSAPAAGWLARSVARTSPS